jgi:hypothetical protein
MAEAKVCAVVALGALMGLNALAAWGQADSASRADSPARSVLNGAGVEFMYPEQVTVAAGKSSEVTLHFRVADGLHINSHAPKDDYLIPTTFSLSEEAGVHLEKALYPDGKEFTLPSDPTSKLSVYTGEFAIQARILAPAGNHLIEAKLRYQACDKNICLPPRTIPVAIDVIGK